MLPENQWTPQEKWVWKGIIKNGLVDFNQEHSYGGNLSPKDIVKWPATRIIRAEFLLTLLNEKKYLELFNGKKIIIGGAWFKELVDLSEIEFPCRIALEFCHFEKPVTLRHSKSKFIFSLNGSVFQNKLDMDNFQVGDSLLLRDKAEFKEVILNGATITNDLSLISSKFNGTLEMNGIKIGRNLFMREGAEFREVDLNSARIGGNVDMTISQFNGKLDMDSIKVGGNLQMHKGAKFSTVILRTGQINGQASMMGSTFVDELNMNGLEVKNSLLMCDGAKFNEVDLGVGKINKGLDLSGSSFSGKLNMNQLSVFGSLFMRDKADFTEVDLGSAKIDGQLSLISSKVNGKLNLDSIHVGQSLIMRDGASFSNIVLVKGKIGGFLIMSSSEFRGQINMNGVRVDGSVFMHDSVFRDSINIANGEVGQQANLTNSLFKNSVNAENLKVGQHLLMVNTVVESDEELTFNYINVGSGFDLSGSELPSIDLSNSQIGGEITFGLLELPIYWKKSARLNLRNSKAGSLHSHIDGWPEELELDGFLYENLGGGSVDKENDIGKRNIFWLKNWLAKQKPFSPNPYHQLARILRNEGKEEKAFDILFAAKERERKESDNFWRKFKLFWEWAFIGYGYKTHYSFSWLLLFIAMGALLLQISGQGPLNKMPYGLEYSLDLFLPIIHLRELHYKIDLQGWLRYYFYFHQIMGYVIASYLVAGLTKLKK